MELIVEPEIPSSCRTGRRGWSAIATGKRLGVRRPDFPNARRKNHPGSYRECPVHQSPALPRIPVEKEALLTAFPFVRPDGSLAAIDFLNARLVEIAGPGLRVIAPLSLQVNDKTLIVIKLDEGRAVQAMGKVRRSVAEGTGQFSIALELIALTNADISEMVRQTNLAAKPMTGKICRSGQFLTVALSSAQPCRRRQDE